MNEPLPQHGGRRIGSGRKKGSTNAENRTKHNFRLMVRSHSETALQAIVDTMNDLNHPERFEAAKLLVQFGFGRAGRLVMPVEPTMGDAGAFVPIDADKLESAYSKGMALLDNTSAAIGGHDEQTID